MFIPCVLMAWRSLASNKLRSSLTMLGNIIGVTCVVALINIGFSGREHIQNTISSVGQNLLFIQPHFNKDGKTHQRYRPLKVADVESLRTNCPALGNVSPLVQFAETVVAGDQNFSAQVLGVWPGYLAMRALKLKSGGIFTSADANAASKICILGYETSKKLFGTLSPIGATVRINRQPLTVTGVLAEKGASAMGEDQDSIVLVPLSTVQKYLIGTQDLYFIVASARTRDDVGALKGQILASVRHSHNLAPDQTDDVEIQDLGEQAKMVDQVLLAATGLLSSIACISLLVGGIGIMNIMLVTVTERTREIGLRLAIGARQRLILFQFVIEAIVLSIVGGIIGAGVGSGLSALTSTLLKMPVVNSLTALALAFFSSLCVGALFGLYPAWRASRLDPIVALRYE